MCGQSGVLPGGGSLCPHAHTRQLRGHQVNKLYRNGIRQAEPKEQKTQMNTDKCITEYLYTRTRVVSSAGGTFWAVSGVAGTFWTVRIQSWRYFLGGIERWRYLLPGRRLLLLLFSHINSHNQVRGHRTGSSHSGAEEYPREKHTQPKVVRAYITADAIHASTRNI